MYEKDPKKFLTRYKAEIYNSPFLNNNIISMGIDTMYYIVYSVYGISVHNVYNTMKCCTYS